MSVLDAQLSFLLACDGLKAVQRTTFLHDGSRAENSAEHSWHLALMALTLGEYAPAGTDINRVVKLVLVHDLVEIGAGDLPFDRPPTEHAAQQQKEQAAADALFSLLPAQQAAEFHALWHEFEEQVTPEARFARALDALHPMLLTWGRGGVGCMERAPELTRERILTLKGPRLQEFPALWQAAQTLLDEAVESGLLNGS
ncbi:HD family hydrolase [Deinococcus antarcticus]|uniref:5'-deoxynucleotidase n=1 Tax=Deinococcus antarcticus TaxID=1298767 RepID=A0ABV8A8U8_9DEIO